MPWCPNCKSEYREEFSSCSDCGADLVEQVEEKIDEELKEEIDWVFFIKTNDEREAEIIQSILQSERIPVLRKDRGAGGYLKIYMGMTNLGIDLYIPQRNFQEATDLIAPNHADFYNAEDEELIRKSNQRSKKIEKRHKTFTWVLVIFLWGLPFLSYILFSILNQLQSR